MPKRVDSTQRSIVEALRRCGVFVFPAHTMGRGFPDLVLVHPRTRTVHLAEVKNGPMGWKLTPAQRKFRALCPAPVVVLTSPQEAVTWAGTVTRGTSDDGDENE